MAKKKSVEEELEGELLNDDDESIEDSLDVEIPADKTKEELADLLSSQLEEEIQGREFKYMQIQIEKDNDKEYYIIVRHQSHGFMNYLVSQVLKCKGVDFVAYKITSLDPPKLYVRVEEGLDIKAVLKEALGKMRTEWKGMKNAVAAMKL
ncbi:MAG: RpoL/Rpb11 RNA polymerase subunit family protein [Promethearchaeota archaeon]